MRPIAIRDGGLGRLDDRDPDGLFEIAALAGQAGAPYDQHVGAVLLSQPAANIDAEKRPGSLKQAMTKAAIDRARDGVGGIRVDHQDAVRHRPISSSWLAGQISATRPIVALFW
jgi:hypothetical protein